MRTKKTAKLPAALSTASKQFERWRKRHRLRERLPQELWRQAAALAGKHGLNPTAHALGLNYYSLKRFSRWFYEVLSEVAMGKRRKIRRRP